MYEYRAYVRRVYDGDTITIAAKLPYKHSPIYRFSVRLNGIDTPEIKGKNEDEKKCAKMARDALKETILNKTVHLENVHVYSQKNPWNSKRLKLHKAF